MFIASKMLFNITVFCVALTVVATAVVNRSSCPEFPATPNLNLLKFAEGNWYLIAQTEREEWNNCTLFETKLKPEKIITKHIYNKEGKKFSFDHHFEADTEKGLFTFPTIRFDNQPDRSFVKTDYDHYNINYACKVNPDGVVAEVVTLNVREADLSNIDKAIEKAQKLLADAGSKITELHPTKRENCPK